MEFKKEGASYTPGCPVLSQAGNLVELARGSTSAYEQDGTAINYDRPVRIMKGVNSHVFSGVALTGTIKRRRSYLPIGKVEDRDASKILSQARLIDTKRPIKKAGTLEKDVFDH